MRVAITGADGYVGGVLAAALEAAGHEVSALWWRAGASGAQVAGRRVVVGDVRDPVALDALLERADAVAHLAAYVHRPAQRESERRECFDVNVGGTRALIDAIARGRQVLPLVFVSTIAVYGPRFERASESSPCAPASPYAESKLAAEREVMEATRAGAVQGCVLRPAVVLGAGAPGNVERLLAWVRRGVVPIVGDGARSMVHVDDLIAIVARALASAGRVSGRVYNVAAEPPVTVRRMVECLARGAGRSPRLVEVPDGIADIAAALSAALAWLGGGRLPDLRTALAVLRAANTVDATAAARDFGFRFRPTEEALEALGATLARRG